MVGGGEQLFRISRERNTLALVRALRHDSNGYVAGGEGGAGGGEGRMSDGRSVERNDINVLYMYEGLTATPIDTRNQEDKTQSKMSISQ